MFKEEIFSDGQREVSEKYVCIPRFLSGKTQRSENCKSDAICTSSTLPEDRLVLGGRGGVLLVQKDGRT